MSKFPGALFSGGSASFSLPNTIEPTRRKTSAQTSQANGTPIITASTVASPAPESRQ
jgi:hypothetical protein